MDNEHMKTSQEAFDEAVKSLHAWLCKYGHPHMTVIADLNHAEVLEGVMVTRLATPD